MNPDDAESAVEKALKKFTLFCFKTSKIIVFDVFLIIILIRKSMQ